MLQWLTRLTSPFFALKHLNIHCLASLGLTTVRGGMEWIAKNNAVTTLALATRHSATPNKTFVEVRKWKYHSAWKLTG